MEEVPPSQSITIVLADDHQVVRAGLRLLLEAEDAFEVVAEAGDGRRPRRRLSAYRPRVLILDLEPPRGVEPARDPAASPGPRPTLRSSSSRCRTIRRSPARPSEPARWPTCSRRPPTPELVQAVRAAAEGRTDLNPELGARLAAAPPSPTGPPTICPRCELEVLRLIALGHTHSGSPRACPERAHGRATPRAH